MAQHYKNRKITLGRIDVTTGWQGFDASCTPPGRRAQGLSGHVWTARDRGAVTLGVCATPGALARPSGAALAALDYAPAALGDRFGPTWATHVFRVALALPPRGRRGDLALLWDAGCEALVMDGEGRAVQGLVGGKHHARRVDCLLADAGVGDGSADEVVLYVETSANGLFGAGRGGDVEPPDEGVYYALEECCLARFCPDAWGVLLDLTVVGDMARDLPEGPARDRALVVANDVVTAVRVGEKETYARGRAVARRVLGQEGGKRGSAPLVHAMLHSHIDLAWLWPASVTPAKAARTFSTQLRLLERYPEAVYVQSQAQLYQWVRDLYPVLFKEVCKQVKAGRFVPVGATWVEMDTNLPSGESLIRQFVLGQAFFEDTFGVTCSNFFLPDTFGYAAQLPQIMRGCGVDYFLTQKLSWNLFNKFPHSTFVWEGIDGARVVAHMPPADTYNAQGFVDEVVRTAHKNKDAGVLPESMMLVGHGDGGGGASPPMVESLLRMHDVQGVPRVHFSTPDKFFASADKVRDELPRWVGELYFELHRGTYTSQAAVKRGNRMCEQTLKIAEALCTHAMVTASAHGYVYPAEKLRESWELVLLNCFHDTLPGSCIAKAYVETRRDYAKVELACQDMQNTALAAIFAAGKRGEETKPAAPAGKPNGQVGGKCAEGVLLVSPNGFARAVGSERPYNFVLPANMAGDDATQKQRTGLDPGEYIVPLSRGPPGLGSAFVPRAICRPHVEESGNAYTVTLSRKTMESAGDVKTGLELFVLKNRFVEATIAASGRVHSLNILSEKDPSSVKSLIVPPAPTCFQDEYGGEGNRLALYTDVPMFWDAWDVEVYAEETPQYLPPARKCKVVENGPYRVMLHFEYSPTRAGSIIQQFISLQSHSPRLDFHTAVDWRESRKILRVSNLTTVRAAQASYDTQFGYVQRPTTWNTSWDISKFEVVGHKFADLSGYGYGISLMSDYKYGYSCRDNDMRLSLLRSPKSPDDTCDMGEHDFTYSLLGHWAAFPCREVLDEAYDLQSPPILINASGALGTFASSQHALVSLGNTGLDSLAISAVKAWDKDPDASAGRRFIVRVAEELGGFGPGSVVVSPALTVEKAVLCDMRERPLENSKGVSVKMNCVEMLFEPFRVHTVLITCSLNEAHLKHVASG